MIMKKRFEILIKGNVQRVGFRNHAAEVADKLGITGTASYVDHDILIEAEGSPAQLDSFIKWCGKGPEGTTIESLEVKETIPLHDLKFVIVHGLIISSEHLA